MLRNKLLWTAIALCSLPAAAANAAVSITFGDFTSPTVLDFNALGAGAIGGTDSYFVSAGISSVSVTGGIAGTDVLDTNVTGNALASVGGQLSIVAPGGALDDGVAAGSPVFDLVFGGARNKFGLSIVDQRGVFQLDFLLGASTIDSASFDTSAANTAYFQAVGLFDTVRISHPSFTGAYGIDNVTFESARIPEPGTLALFGLGLAGLGAMRRKKLAA